MPSRWDIEREVLHSQIPPLARLIVLVLAIKSDNKTAVVPIEHTPTLSALADMTGIARGSVADWLNALEASGWVIRSKPAKRGSKTDRTTYALAVGAGEVALSDRAKRVPRPRRGSELSADGNASRPPRGPEDEAPPVREADVKEPPSRPRGGPSPVREADSSRPRGGHALTTPPPTGEGTTKNHQRALAIAERPDGEIEPEGPTAEIISSTPLNKPSIPAQRWAEGDRKPTTPSAVHGRSAALFPKPKPAAVESWMEIHQVIYRWLQANGFQTLGLDEVRQIHTQLSAAHPGKGLRYLISVIGSGGCAGYAQAIRKERHKKVEALVLDMQANLPQCPHGTPGGDHPHPTTGNLLCVQCRHGIPATIVEDATDPDVQAALDAYRHRRGNDIYFDELLRTTQQIEAFLDGGATPDQVVALAEIAGEQRISLIRAAGVAA